MATAQFLLALRPHQAHPPRPGSAVAQAGPSTGRVSLSAVPTKSSQSLSYVTAISTHHSQQVAWKQAGRREEIKNTQSLNSAPFPPCEWLGGDRLIPSCCSTRTPAEPPCERHCSTWAKINTSMTWKNFRLMQHQPGKGVVDRGDR